MNAILLPVRLDISTVEALSDTLSTQMTQDLTLDASEVLHLGANGLQLLLSAARSARANGICLAVTPRSSAFDEALADMAVPLSALESGGASACL